jgi:hypothetical protein
VVHSHDIHNSKLIIHNSPPTSFAASLPAKGSYLYRGLADSLLSFLLSILCAPLRSLRYSSLKSQIPNSKSLPHRHYLHPIMPRVSRHLSIFQAGNFYQPHPRHLLSRQVSLQYTRLLIFRVALIYL